MLGAPGFKVWARLAGLKNGEGETGHGGVRPHLVLEVAEADVGPAPVKGPREAHDQPRERRESHGDDRHHHRVHDVAVAY